jgi:hypothetical protein
MMNQSTVPQPPTLDSSQLFSVRLWQERDEHDRTIVRGKAQHVLSGETYYFEDWRMLDEFLAEQMQALAERAM